MTSLISQYTQPDTVITAETLQAIRDDISAVHTMLPNNQRLSRMFTAVFSTVYAEHEEGSINSEDFFWAAVSGRGVMCPPVASTTITRIELRHVPDFIASVARIIGDAKQNSYRNDGYMLRDLMNSLLVLDDNVVESAHLLQMMLSAMSKTCLISLRSSGMGEESVVSLIRKNNIWWTFIESICGLLLPIEDKCSLIRQILKSGMYDGVMGLPPISECSAVKAIVNGSFSIWESVSQNYMASVNLDKVMRSFTPHTAFNSDLAYMLPWSMYASIWEKGAKLSRNDVPLLADCLEFGWTIAIARYVVDVYEAAASSITRPCVNIGMISVMRSALSHHRTLDESGLAEQLLNKPNPMVIASHVADIYSRLARTFPEKMIDKK